MKALSYLRAFCMTKMSSGQKTHSFHVSHHHSPIHDSNRDGRQHPSGHQQHQINQWHASSGSAWNYGASDQSINHRHGYFSIPRENSYRNGRDEVDGRHSKRQRLPNDWRARERDDQPRSSAVSDWSEDFPRHHQSTVPGYPADQRLSQESYYRSHQRTEMSHGDRHFNQRSQRSYPDHHHDNFQVSGNWSYDQSINHNGSRHNSIPQDEHRNATRHSATEHKGPSKSGSKSHHRPTEAEREEWKRNGGKETRRGELKEGRRRRIAERKAAVVQVQRIDSDVSKPSRDAVPYSGKKRTFLPDGWLDYTKIGKIIEGTRILCLKTPIDSAHYYRLDDDSVQFRTEHFFRDMEDRNLRVGLLVDLTYTTKYYHGRSVTEQRGVKFVKIAVPGKAIPPEEQYLEFRRELDDFLSTSSSDQIVAVHCTHGVNRTGWFVCRYLMDSLKFTMENARHAFAEARGHDIYRDYLIHDLENREARALLLAVSSPSLTLPTQCLM